MLSQSCGKYPASTMIVGIPEPIQKFCLAGSLLAQRSACGAEVETSRFDLTAADCNFLPPSTVTLDNFDKFPASLDGMLRLKTLTV
jgi:hypothetical protein